jgi:glycosyltransferase involved in cell wall biosynthesis
MRKPVLTIFYQFNPWHSSIGGIQTIIRAFVKHAPDDFHIRIVGTGSDSDEATMTWRDAEYVGKSIQFMPLFILKNDNHRKLIPISIGYTAALLRRCLESDFMHFHRIEPCLATQQWQGEKTLFVHNDVSTQCLTTTSGRKMSPWRYFPAVYSALEGYLLPQFDQIFSCHTGSLERYHRLYPNLVDRISYIQNSFDNEEFYPLSFTERRLRRQALAHQLNLPEATKFILFAGRLHPQKDPILLVRAIAALNDPNTHLLIAGDGDMVAEIQAEVAHLGIRDRITLLGPQTAAAIANLYHIASLVVLTSSFEGFPVVVLEALACGTPVVTTECGDTPRLLTANTGIVCKERTPTAIAAALNRVLQHPEAFPSEACVKTVTRYTAQTIIGQQYAEMRSRWEKRNAQARLPSYST